MLRYRARASAPLRDNCPPLLSPPADIGGLGRLELPGASIVAQLGGLCCCRQIAGALSEEQRSLEVPDSGFMTMAEAYPFSFAARGALPLRLAGE